MTNRWKCIQTYKGIILFLNLQKNVPWMQNYLLLLHYFIDLHLKCLKLLFSYGPQLSSTTLKTHCTWHTIDSVCVMEIQTSTSAEGLLVYPFDSSDVSSRTEGPSFRIETVNNQHNESNQWIGQIRSQRSTTYSQTIYDFFFIYIYIQLYP